MYEGYRDDAKFILLIYESSESDVEIEKLKDARYRRDEYIQKYNKFFDWASQLKDWRKKIARTTFPEECTEENLVIPNTEGSIDGKIN